MKKGISLVALVVTIIVMIILTGAVIATFMEGGIIDRSNEAVEGNDYTVLVETYGVKKAEAQIDYEIDGIEYDEIEVLKETTDSLSISKDFIYADGTVKYVGENNKIAIWIANNFTHKELVDAGFYISVIDGKAYMTGIKTESSNITTTVEEILALLPEGYIIKDNDGNEVSNTVVTTGYKIIDDNNEEYTSIVVKGEFNYDKKINIDDTHLLRVFNLHGDFKDNKEMTTERMLACDMDNNGILSKEDLEFANKIISTNFDSNLMKLLQQGPTAEIKEKRLGEYIYGGYDEDAMLKAISDNGYPIEVDEDGYFGETIEIPSGTTYKKLEDDIQDILYRNNLLQEGLDKEEIYIEPTHTDNKTAVIQNGETFRLFLTYKIKGEIQTLSTIRLETIVK